jgi:hypothetical protein
LVMVAIIALRWIPLGTSNLATDYPGGEVIEATPSILGAVSHDRVVELLPKRRAGDAPSGQQTAGQAYAFLMSDVVGRSCFHFAFIVAA